MKNILPVILILLALSACKTTEANYRAAYDKAIAGRDSSEALENTIYGRERRNVNYSYIPTTDGDTIPLRKQLVKITEGGGGLRENLKQYCVVIGQFKQKFNAVSMRDRFALEDNSPVPGAFVVETGEPYYYVIGASYSELAPAIKELKTLKKSSGMTFREPLPYILQATAVNQRNK